MTAEQMALALKYEVITVEQYLKFLEEIAK